MTGWRRTILEIINKVIYKILKLKSWLFKIQAIVNTLGNTPAYLSQNKPLKNIEIVLDFTQNFLLSLRSIW